MHSGERSPECFYVRRAKRGEERRGIAGETQEREKISPRKKAEKKIDKRERNHYNSMRDKTDTEWYRSGHNEHDWKSCCRGSGTRVQIPPTPPSETRLNPEGSSEFSFALF